MSQLHERAFYYLGQNRSCSEAVWEAACDVYGISDREGIVKALGAYSGGGGFGGTCGALLAATAVCATFKIKTIAHECPDLKPTQKMMAEEFLKKCGSLSCDYIKPMNAGSKAKCSGAVFAACDALEKQFPLKSKE